MEAVMKKEDTRLEIFTFGDRPEDIYYCLVDLRVNPDGLDIEKLKLSDPRNLDRMFRDTGCLILLTSAEIDELVRRGELSRKNLHSSIYRLCKKEDII